MASKVFDPALWIGQGKKYIVEELPDYVVDTKCDLLNLPQDARDYLPPNEMPISIFLNHRLPTKLSELITVRIEDCFSKDRPTTNIVTLAERPIPSNETIQLLDKAIGQAWLDGNQSIIDWRGGERIDFWAITFWREMSMVITKQKQWSYARSSFQSTKRGAGLPDDTKISVDELLENLGWNVQLPILRAVRSDELTAFFGTRWLNDNHLDMMVEEMNGRITISPNLIGRVAVAPAFFAADIMTISKASHARSRLVSRYEKGVKEGKVRMIYFPVNVHNNHWIAAYIDIQNSRIGYGDSLSASGLVSPPTTFMKALLAWVNATFPGPFKLISNDLHCGQQKETYNCGIYTANTIAHAIFGDELLTSKSVKYERLNWFVKCANYARVHTQPEQTPKESPVTRPDIPNLLNPWPETFMPIEFDGDVNQPADSETFEEVSDGELDRSAEVLSPIPEPKDDGEDTSDDANPDDGRGESGWSSADFLASGSDDESDYDGDSSGEERRKAIQASSQTRTKGGEGTSKSAIWGREARKKLRDGTFMVDRAKQAKYQQELRKFDPSVAFHPQDIRKAKHWACGAWVTAKTPYDTVAFRNHVGKCTGKEKNGLAKTPLLTQMTYFISKNSLQPPSKKRKTASDTESDDDGEPLIPCRGLTNADHQDIEKYLRRSTWGGGGGPSVTKLCKKRFPGKAYKDLTKDQQSQLEDEQKHGWSWRNDYDRKRVYSTMCKKESRRGLCHPCKALLHFKRFQTALWRKVPTDANAKYVPLRYQNIMLGKLYARIKGLRSLVEKSDEINTPYIRYALGIANGKYKRNEVFEGLLRAVLSQQDRESRGVGMQNFKYAPGWDETCHMLQIQSPSAYRLIRKHFPARSARSFKYKVSRLPRFPMQICTNTFEMVKSYLDILKYDGMVGLSCDDTKLFSALRLFWDGENDKHFLVGSTKGPLEVANPEHMREVLEYAKKNKATKLRLFCLMPEVPKAAPIIVAALPIASNLGARTLYTYTLDVLQGLIRVGIKVVSYASDGTEVERSVGKMLIENADWKHTYVIKNPRRGWADTCATVIKVDGQLLVVVQDSKHCTKTLRNNLFSGTSCLTLGNYIAIFSHVATVATEAGTPLFRRDVFKLDRQDDNAATRLFSAETLDFISNGHPEYAAEIVYLFVFGELGDAYQNRKITHHERLHMVLRAQYFLDRWECWLTACGYPKKKHFLSREALDIIRIMVEGYVGLMFLHRDSDEENAVPFIPWLHSTEACEHVFGEARRIVKDFCMLDFVYMIPKLTVALRQAALEARSSDAKATASGYNHTYLDSTQLDVMALASYPDDDRVSEIAAAAAEDVDTLLQLIGIVPARLNRVRLLQQTSLPSINTWFQGFNAAGDDSDDEDGDQESSESQQLQDILDAEEADTQALSRKGEHAMLNIACAAAALAVDDMSCLNEIHQDTDTLLEQHLEDEQQNVQQHRVAVKRFQLPPIHFSQWDEERNLLGLGRVSNSQLDFSKLVEIRRLHETHQAATGVRTRRGKTSVDGRTSARRALLKHLHAVLREEDDQIVGAGTGAERSLRWGIPMVSDSAGNAANAEVVSKAAAAQAANRRRAIYTRTSCPLLDLVGNGRVSELRPIIIGDYGLIFHNEKVRLAKVHAMYAKSGGKNGRHNDVANRSNLSALSYLSVQIFEHQHSDNGLLIFSNETERTALLQVSEFAHIYSYQFLLLVAVLSDSDKIMLAEAETGYFQLLSERRALQALEWAMKEFRKRNQSDE